MTKKQAEKAIRKMVAECDSCDLDTEKFRAALKAYGWDSAEYADDSETIAYAAAIEYYDGDINKAVRVINDWGNGDDYIFINGATTSREVGEGLLEVKADVIPEWMFDYINIKELGEDYARNGIFTRFGWFSDEVFF